VIVRVLNLIVIGALVLAAAYVYRIKYEAAAQAERLDKLRDEARHERDKIAALRAQWEELDDPARIETLAKRFLKLKPVDATQFDDLDHLPDEPPSYMRPGSRDPIGGMIEHLEEPVTVTGSVTPPPAAGADTGDASPPASDSNASGTPAPVIAAPLESGAHSP
jgi:cell division protein FtsL